MSFTLEFTDLDGAPLTRLSDYLSARVEIPLCDARTASVSLSVYDPTCAFIRPLRHMLKAWWYEHLVFWGVMLTPRWAAADSTVEVPCHDPSLKWKKGFHRYGDQAVEEPIPPDGRGIRILSESAEPSADQLTRGVKPTGIVLGNDTATDVTNEVLWAKVERGTNIFQSITRLTETIPGAEFNLRPVEGLPTGFFVALDTFDQMSGADLTQDVIFHYGWGRNNLDDMVLEEDGDQVINYAVVNNPKGEKDAIDDANRALSHAEQSWLDLGIYQAWESVGQEEHKDVLQLRANSIVAANDQPQKVATITPTREGPNSYRYIDDFDVGDFLSAVARVGHMPSDPVNGRVTRVTLNEDQEAASTEIELLPYNPADVEPDDT